MHDFTTAFWPRFSFSRNDQGNQVSIEDILNLKTAPSTEFWRGSCCDSQIGWRGHICKFLPGCITLNSQTPMKGHALVLDLGKKIRAGLAVGMGLGRG